MKLFTLIFATVLLLVHDAQCYPTSQFDHFLPGWNGIIQDIKKDACLNQTLAFKHGNDTNGLPPGARSSAYDLLNCILEEFPEFRKAELAASAVILGLLPTILQSLGSTTAETALLGLRRPLLSTLLVAGSPAIVVSKGSSFIEEVSQFIEGTSSVKAINGLDTTELLEGWSFIISMTEYTVILGVVANVAQLAYQLGVNAVVVFSPGTNFLLPLWAFLSLAIHFGALFILNLLVKTEDASTDGYNFRTKIPGLLHLFEELVPHAFQSPKQLVWRRETFVFTLLSWVLSVGTLVHIVFGTLVLSSLLFFSVRDAITIVARFAASAMISRAVVRFELAGMNERSRYRAV